MKKNLLLAALFSCSVSMVMAADAPPQGDPAAGKAKVGECTACHGADGNSPSPAFPKLASLGERYLLKQMQDILCGFKSAEEQKASKCTARSVPTMAGQLDAFSQQDLADIAAYYASQPIQVGQADPELVALGEQIYRAGIKEKGVAACTACHSPTGKGNAPAGFPALGGQHAAYIDTQLKAFREGADYNGERGRNNDGDTKIMRAVADKLSDREIEAVASYISGLY